jgi:polyhydroxyalkanoate synthesis regulator phasin
LERLGRLRDLAQHFSRSKRILGTARSNIDSVRDEIDSLRMQLLDLVDELYRSLDPDRDHGTSAVRVA